MIRLRSKGAMARHDGKATRHSPEREVPRDDAGLASAEFRTDSTCVAKATPAEQVAPWLATGCFTFRRVIRVDFFLGGYARLTHAAKKNLI
jgi:hypothetical protein